MYSKVRSVFTGGSRASADAESDYSTNTSRRGKEMQGGPYQTSTRARHLDPQGRSEARGAEVERPMFTSPFIEPSLVPPPPPTQELEQNSGRRADEVSNSTQRAEKAETRWRGEDARRGLLERENGELKEEMQRMQAQMHRLAEENWQYIAQVNELKIREAAVQDAIQAQAFGGTANLTSTADVRAIMEDLEAEIFQTAAALSEFDFSGRSQMHRPELDPDLHNRVTHVLGSELVGLLSAKEAPEILVQTALQAAMSTWSWLKVGSWVLDRRDHGPDAFWTKLYADIRRSEDSKDAARWRAMTRKHLIERNSSSGLTHSLLRRIMDVLTVRCGEALNWKVIEVEFGDRISAVAGLVLKLNRDIGENIVSEDLEVVLPKPGETFDPNEMENMWPNDERSGSRAMSASEQLVVCSMCIGLRKRGDDGGHAMLFMKPKVLLRLTLGELIA